MDLTESSVGWAQCKPKRTMQALKYLLYACNDCDGRKERRRKVLCCLKMVGCLLKTRCMVLLEKSTSFYKPIGHIMTKFHSLVEMEPRTGIRPQKKGIGCKKSHGETQR